MTLCLVHGVNSLCAPKACVRHFLRSKDLSLLLLLHLARAIENQCYVLAAAQHGKHNEKRVSFGHSLVSVVTSNQIKYIGVGR